MQRCLAKKEATEAVESAQGIVDQFDKTVDDTTFATLTTCDAKTGVTVKVWDAASCEGKPEVTYTAEWKKCTQFGDKYYLITGAAALKAAAIAVVAFAGSQF